MANFLKLNKSYLGPEVLSNGSFEEYGPDLVINGDFATDSNWTVAAGSGWTISNGKASNDGSNGNLQQSSILDIGKVYLITITVSDYVSGNVQVSAGAGPRGTVTANGTYTFTQTAQNNSSFYLVSSAFVGSVESVSVQESGAVELVDNGQFIGVANGTDVTFVSSQWTFSSLTSSDIESNVLECIASGPNEFAYLQVPTVVGGEYRFKVDSVTGDLASDSVRVQGESVDVTSGSGELVFTATNSPTIIQFYAGDTFSAAQTNYTGISLQSTNQLAYDYLAVGSGQHSVFDFQAKTLRFVAESLSGRSVQAVGSTSVGEEYLIKIDVAEIVGSAPFVYWNGSFIQVNVEVGENEIRYKRVAGSNGLYFGIQAQDSSQIGSSITLNSISWQEVVNQPKLIGVDNVSMVSAPTDNTVVINNGLTDGADELTITYAGASASSRVQMRNFFQDSIIRLANSNNTAEVLEITPPVLITDIVAS